MCSVDPIITGPSTSSQQQSPSHHVQQQGQKKEVEDLEAAERSNVVFGFTIDYASPEQLLETVLDRCSPAHVVEDALISAATDLWSLAATAFRMLFGSSVLKPEMSRELEDSIKLEQGMGAGVWTGPLCTHILCFDYFDY
jgi:serine/threonine protein kinase